MASRCTAPTEASGELSLVVVPSGSVMVMLTRTPPAGRTGRQSIPAARSSVTKGSSLAAGTTAGVGSSAMTDAREMVTPSPPLWTVTERTRCT